MRVAALIPLGFFLGAIASRIALLHPPSALSVDLQQPLVVVTYWQQFGGVMWLALFTSIAIASIGYIFVIVTYRVASTSSAALRQAQDDTLAPARSAVLSERSELKGHDDTLAPARSAVLSERSELKGHDDTSGERVSKGSVMVSPVEPPLSLPKRLSTITALSAIACAAALAFPVVFSSDVYAYAGYGDMALHGINPYAHARILVRDPLLDAMQWQWGNPPPMCVYGPAFVWLSKLIVATIIPLGTAAALWGFRILACCALIACAPLAYAAFKPFPHSTRMLAAAGIALNPVAIWASAEGHNDSLVLALVLTGFAIAARRTILGAAVISFAALVKAPALAAAVAYAISAWQSPQRLRVLLGAIAGAAIVLALAVPLEYGVSVHLAPAGRFFPQYSMQYVLATFLPLPIAAGLTLGACAVLAVSGLRRLYFDDVSGAIGVALAAWFALPNPYPWYSLWILPTAFLARDVRAMWAVIAASLLAVFRYYVEATASSSVSLSIVIVLLQFTLPAALLIAAYTDRARRGHPGNHTAVPDFAPLRFR